MTLSPGTRFGPHEITAPLGAGDKGEVYNARDAQLKRTVLEWRWWVDTR